MPNDYPQYWPQFFTATLLNWQPLLQNNTYKDEIVKCLQFLIAQKRIKLFSFVIMNNHIHLIWQPLQNQTLSTIQHSFVKHTAQVFKADLLKTNPSLLENYKVKATDRTYQFWEGNSLSIELRSSKVFNQKLDYIHYNAVKDGLCKLPEEYHYSSAKFYFEGVDTFEMLSHANE